MTTQTKTEQAAEFFQTVLNDFHQSNSQNVRFRSEVERLQGKVSTLEQLLDQKERRLRLLVELLERRTGQYCLPAPIESGSEVLL